GLQSSRSAAAVANSGMVGPGSGVALGVPPSRQNFQLSVRVPKCRGQNRTLKIAIHLHPKCPTAANRTGCIKARNEPERTEPVRSQARPRTQFSTEFLAPRMTLHLSTSRRSSVLPIPSPVPPPDGHAIGLSSFSHCTRPLQSSSRANGG